MTETNTAKLAELIDKRHRCLLSLRELSAKQAGMISGGDMQALLRSFSVKNQWIVALQTIERELAPYHQQEPESRSWQSEPARQKCAQQAADCTRLLAELMELEKQNEREMTQRRDQVAAQLQTVQSADAARTAYQSQQNMRRDAAQTPRPNIAEDLPVVRLDLQSEAR